MTQRRQYGCPSIAQESRENRQYAHQWDHSPKFASPARGVTFRIAQITNDLVPEEGIEPTLTVK